MWSRWREGVLFQGGHIAHFDEVGNDKVNSRQTDSPGKRVLWLDGKSIIGEAQFIENLVKHPVALHFDSSNASEVVT